MQQCVAFFVPSVYVWGLEAKLARIQSAQPIGRAINIIIRVTIQ